MGCGDKTGGVVDPLNGFSRKILFPVQGLNRFIPESTALTKATIFINIYNTNH
jgi:hypothetical protein